MSILIVTQLLVSRQNYQPGTIAVTTYFKRVTISTLNGTVCRDTSNCVTIRIDIVIAGTIGSDQTICSGSTPAQLTGTTGTGSGIISYLWLSNTTGCNGPWTVATGTNNGQNYQPGALTITTYYKRVTLNTLNGFVCSDTSNCVTITIDNVTAGTIGSDQTICNGSTPSQLTGTTGTGSGVLTYQWLSNTTGCKGPWVPAAGTNNTQNYQPGV